MDCTPCKDSFINPNKATRKMPQSVDQGVTVTYVLACDMHVDGWWDGADWDGRHLESVIA